MASNVMAVDESDSISTDRNSPSISWESVNRRYEVYKPKDMAMERILSRYNGQDQDQDQSVPPKEFEERLVFRSWQRDPNGRVMKITPPGKQAGNGYELWGATLYDFYYLRRIPSMQNAVTQSTGSKLAAWMKDIGELSHAKHELETAKKEPDPIIISPFKAGEWIRDFELRVNKGDWIGFQDSRKSTDKGKKKSNSIFRPSNHPDPWPILPFSAPTYRIEDKIPFHLLPQKLFVHDPWNCLATPDCHSEYGTDDYSSGEDDREKGKQKENMPSQTPKLQSWSDKTDVIRMYTLRLSESASKEREAHDKQIREYNGKSEDENSAKMKRKPEYLHLLPQEHIPQMMYTRYGHKFKDRPILVKVPPRPDRPRVPEAHLYIKPTNKIAIGHHSFVYQAELEVPRWLIVDDQLCRQCVLENLVFEPEPSKDGTQENDAFEHSDNNEMDVDEEPDAGAPTKTEADKKAEAKKIMDYRPQVAGPIILNDDEGYAERYKRKKKKKKKKKAKSKGKGKAVDSETVSDSDSDNEEDENFVYGEYSGPPIYASTTAKWQNSDLGPFCEHLSKHGGKALAIPPTAKVSVVAKLSLLGDPHLEREAVTYQTFPSHLSEHWSGYNLIRPMNEPAPLRAVVPQFYGYYTSDDVKLSDNRTWLSPILLMENCGEPVNPNRLPIDERRECISLLLRLHLAGFLHGSVFQRNILMQPGPLEEPPIFRSMKNPSFRLVDFGRTEKHEPSRRWNEQNFGYEELKLAFEAF